MKQKIANELYKHKNLKTRLAHLLKIKNNEDIAKLLEMTRPTLDKYL